MPSARYRVMLTCPVGITIVVRMHQRSRPLIALALVSALVLGACSSGGSKGSSATSGGGAGATTKLSLVSFSVPKAAHDAAQAAFAKTTTGNGVTWTNSYGASGDQSRAVASGLKADVVHFSLESDVTRLVTAGLVPKDWNAGAHKGIISDSVVVIAVRKGNPKHITGWDDLVKPGIGIVTPNPGSSGSARWNILAAWGHVLATGGTEADASTYLTKFFKNTVSLPGSGRDATTAFTGGLGDVLISYENEAILARQNGNDFDYIVPDQSILIENPAAVTVGANAKAQQYLDFIVSAAGQTEFAKVGFRPIIDGVDVSVRGANDPSHPFPAVKQLLTIDKDFGGWTRSRQEVLRSDHRDHHQDPAVHRQELTLALETGPDVGRPARARRSAGAGDLAPASRLGLGVATLWFSLLVLLPLAAILVETTGGGWARFWATLTNAADGRGAAADHRPGVPGHRGERRDGHADRLGARAGPVLGQGRARGAHRRALRPAHDRGRARAALALWAPQPDRRRRGQHPQCRVPRVPVRHPALRRAHRGAGAGRVRPRRGGGRGVARGEPAGHLPPRDPAQPRPRHQRRGRPVLRPGHQRVRLPRPAVGQPAA